MKTKSIESQAIDILRILLSVFVVFFHAYTSTQGYGWLEVDKPFYRTVTYIFSLQLGEIGVPAFFLISGYLFFRNTGLTLRDYKRKMYSRVWSLLIPYIFWNLVFILLFYIIEQLPELSQYFSGANKRVSDYTWIDFLRAFWDRGDWQGGNGVPFDWPLWFVRNLFCLCLLSPVVKLFVQYGRLYGVVLLSVVWYMSATLAFTSSSIFFFSLGAYFSLIRGRLIVDSKKLFFFVMILYPLLFLADLFTQGMEYHLIIHRTGIIAGIFYVFYLVAFIIRHRKIAMGPGYASLAFFLYVVHGPLMNVLRKMTVKLFGAVSDVILVLLYFIDIILVIGFVMILYILLSRYAPRFLNFVLGR